DCTVLEIDEKTGLLHQTRPAFGGNLMATIMCPAHRPQMATVRPGIFCAPEADTNRTGKVTDVELDAAVASRVRVVEHIPADSQASIAEAKRLLVLGRGIGSKKNLPVMRRLAELLGAEIGCTRPLVEAGWLEYHHQVGQTGISVAPELLISLGVSGAIQHLAGISGAQTVVAVNEDADAPIFNAAQYAIVGDCVKVAQRLIAQLETR
ncbi:electron transfer flavoprotein subunit alpha/FixB family protein, partial [Collinsella bouchesdurhonensis]|uniref:electron transfer flavoprotein subunit alpha/FixB family protein n=1 Tax=Collinsella bouchesdurhonensis TaxID=1907654 RepID=UPI0034A3EEC5